MSSWMVVLKPMEVSKLGRFYDLQGDVREPSVMKSNAQRIGCVFGSEKSPSGDLCSGVAKVKVGGTEMLLND
jgi:hypothetical protein